MSQLELIALKHQQTPNSKRGKWQNDDNTTDSERGKRYARKHVTYGKRGKTCSWWRTREKVTDGTLGKIMYLMRKTRPHGQSFLEGSGECLTQKGISYQFLLS